MADPLDKIKDLQRRAELLWLRMHEDELVTSEQLKRAIRFEGEMGIYKPSKEPHALWIRQTLRKKYPDKDPEERADGSWTYDYAPEDRKGKPDLTLHTNKSLLQCKADGVPVGVLRQVKSKSGKATYRVHGIAFVEDFDGTHFRFRSEPIAVDQKPATEDVIPFVMFETKHVAPAQRQVRDVRFAKKVGRAYREKCAACEIGFQLRGSPLGLEAAHIVPQEKSGTSLDVRNGILLCANHHALYDGYCWFFDEDFRVTVTDDPQFRASAKPNHILKIEGKQVPNLPEDENLRPAVKAIEYRRKQYEDFWAK